MAHYQQEKEQGTERCCNPGEPQEHYAKWKMLQKTVYCMIPFIWNFQSRKIYKNREVA